MDGWLVGYLKVDIAKLEPQGAKKSSLDSHNTTFLTKKTKPYPRSSTCSWQDYRAHLSPRSPGIPFMLPTCTLQRAFPNPIHFAAEWCACSLLHCRSSSCKGVRWDRGGGVRAVKAPKRVEAWRGLKKVGHKKTLAYPQSWGLFPGRQHASMGDRVARRPRGRGKCTCTNHAPLGFCIRCRAFLRPASTSLHSLINFMQPASNPPVAQLEPVQMPLAGHRAPLGGYTPPVGLGVCPEWE